MGVDTDEGSSDEGNFADADEIHTPQVVRKPKAVKPKRQSSFSQPSAKRNRSVSFGSPELDTTAPGTPSLEPPISFHKILTKLQRDLTEMKSFVKKQLPSIVTALEELKNDMSSMKSKVVHLAPPINLENELQQLSQKVDKVSQQVDHVSSPTESVKLQEVFDVEQKLRSRKMKYFDFHSHTERHAIYSSWETSDPPFTLSKYLPAHIADEPLEEYQARKETAEAIRACDMKLLTLRAQRAKAAVDRIDAEVAQIISDTEYTDVIKTHLTDEWLKLIKTEEGKSHQIWEKTAKNLRDTPLRQVENNRVIEDEGKTYASVVKKPKPSKKDGEKDETQKKAPKANTDNQKFTVAKGKKRSSHVEGDKPKTAASDGKGADKRNTAGKSTSFRKKGPKFKPKQWGGWNYNQWEHPNYNPNWWWG